MKCFTLTFVLLFNLFYLFGAESGVPGESVEPKSNQEKRTLPANLNSEPETLPSWVLFGLGKRALDQRNFAEAVVDFRRAIQRKGIYPEAEWALARIAGMNGNPTLQESLLEKALDESGLLAVPEDRIQILYELAALRQLHANPQTKEKGEAALETYREILHEDPVYRAAENSGGLEGYFKAFMAAPSTVVYKTGNGPSPTAALSGLNRLLYLYPQTVDFSLKAHQEVARMAMENKAYRMAASECLFSVTVIFSTVIQEVRKIHPDYTFRDLAELLVQKDSPVYLGKPEGSVASRVRPGAPNPGWFVRYQPIWDYLKDVRAKETLVMLAQCLKALEEGEKSLKPSPQTRTAKDAAAEALKWASYLEGRGTDRPTEIKSGQTRH